MSGGAASKAKGSAFERMVCTKLSLWVTDHKRDDVFWRSAMSGGRATLAYRRGKIIQVTGDICAVAPEGHKLTDYWHIECKHLKSLDMLSLILKDKGVLAHAWQKTCKQAHEHNKFPMLIARQNLYPIIVMTPPGCSPYPSLAVNTFYDITLLDNMIARPYSIPRMFSNKDNDT